MCCYLNVQFQGQRVNLLDGNLNTRTIEITTEVLLNARWEDRLEEDAGTAMSNCIICMILFVIGSGLVVWNIHAFVLRAPVKIVLSNQISNLKK